MSEGAFLISWSAIVLKRIVRCSYLYCEHQKIDLDAKVLLKSLKYNLFAPTGIVFQLIPYLEKALKNGFLMPKEYSDNDAVKKAVRLFGDAYRISQISDIENQKKEANTFLIKVLETFKESDNEKENKEILSIPNFKRSENPHSCTLCELIDAWDIDVSLCNFHTHAHSLLLYTLLQILSSCK